MTRRLWIVAGLALACGTAHADVMRATRETPMIEVSHTVEIKIVDGVATYRVRRVFSNPGKVADQVELEIGLPYGAAATGLRIRAKDRWYDGELMEREKAAAIYRELTGMGTAAPKDPALLAWMWADKLSLQVFPVFPGSRSTVEYTLTAPTRYEHGRYFVSYPRVAVSPEPAGGDRPLAIPVITVHPSWADARTAIMVDGRRVTAGAPIALVPLKRESWADTISAAPTASYVASALTMPASRHTTTTFATAVVELSLAHTYKGDLRIELITPQGKSVTLHDMVGGGDNNLRGKFPVELPEGTTGAGTWRLVVSDHAALDTGTLDHWSLTIGEGKTATTVVAKDTPLFVPDAPESASDAGLATISIAPPTIATWHARLGRIVASADHAFSRLEIDVAPQLVPTPKRAQVAFVIDTSYSQGEPGVAAQLDVVRAYLTHLPDAEVEIVTYRRRAQRAFGTFIPAARLAAALAAAKASGAFALGNGSALDEGAHLAATALADRTGPRRVVIATDELLRSSLAPATSFAALRALSAETVVHVLVPRIDGDDRPRLARNDEATFAPLATSHHGIYVELGGLPTRTIKELAPIVLELVRPTRIESLTATGFTLDSDVLHEGDGVRMMVDNKNAPTRTMLAGKLWSDPVRREVVVDQAFSRDTAAFVFGADEHHALSDTEMMTVALAGRAVSPVTSYVAVEPGTRPSTIGLDHGTIGTGRYGTVGRGAGYGGASEVRVPDLKRLINTRACLEKVRPTAAWTLTLMVETTKDEIVDVRSAAASPLAACLIEATWATRLDDQFFADRQQFTVALSGPAAP